MSEGFCVLADGMVKSTAEADDMDIAKKLLAAGKPTEALERLKTLLPNVDADNQWRVH